MTLDWSYSYNLKKLTQLIMEALDESTIDENDYDGSLSFDFYGHC